MRTTSSRIRTSTEKNLSSQIPSNILLHKWKTGQIKNEKDFRLLLGLIPGKDDHIVIPRRKEDCNIEWIRGIISGDVDKVREKLHIKIFLADSQAHPNNMDLYFRGKDAPFRHTFKPLSELERVRNEDEKNRVERLE